MKAIKEYRLNHKQDKTTISFDHGFRLLKIVRIDMNIHLLVEMDYKEQRPATIEVKHCLSNNVITEQDATGELNVEFEYLDSVVVSSNRVLNFFYRIVS